MTVVRAMRLSPASLKNVLVGVRSLPLAEVGLLSSGSTLDPIKLRSIALFVQRLSPQNRIVP